MIIRTTRKGLPRVVLLVAFSMVVVGCTTGANTDKKRSLWEPDRTMMSPGPKGGLIDRDYRVPVTWLENPRQHGPGDYVRWLSFGGLKRYHEVHVPQSYKSGRPTPVMFVIHGGGGNPAIVRYQSGMNRVSERNGFIVMSFRLAAELSDRIAAVGPVGGIKVVNHNAQMIQAVQMMAAVYRLFLR